MDIDITSLDLEFGKWMSEAKGDPNLKLRHLRFGQYLMNNYTGVPEVFYATNANEVYATVYAVLAEQQ